MFQCNPIVVDCAVPRQGSLPKRIKRNKASASNRFQHGPLTRGWQRSGYHMFLSWQCQDLLKKDEYSDFRFVFESIRGGVSFPAKTGFGTSPERVPICVPVLRPCAEEAANGSRDNKEDRRAQSSSVSRRRDDGRGERKLRKPVNLEGKYASVDPMDAGSAMAASLRVIMMS